MKVSIKTVKGEVFSVDCSETDKILFLKEKVFEKFQFELDTQKLIYRGKHLDENKTIAEGEIKDGDCIILMIVKVSSREGHSKTKRRSCCPKTSSRSAASQSTTDSRSADHHHTKFWSTRGSATAGSCSRSSGRAGPK